jgi:hypothetical protein
VNLTVTLTTIQEQLLMAFHFWVINKQRLQQPTNPDDFTIVQAPQSSSDHEAEVQESSHTNLNLPPIGRSLRRNRTHTLVGSWYSPHAASYAEIFLKYKKVERLAQASVLSREFA